jgi:hypothetical protein
MKISQIKKRENFYPLVDNFVRRIDSINFVKELGLRPPQRSSCVFCPFHSNRYWDWLKTYHPTEFNRACEFERKVQDNQARTDFITSKVFLHSTCKPLGEINFVDKDQLSLFPELIDECDGLCGI